MLCWSAVGIYGRIPQNKLRRVNFLMIVICTILMQQIQTFFPGRVGRHMWGTIFTNVFILAPFFAQRLLTECNNICIIAKNKKFLNHYVNKTSKKIVKRVKCFIINFEQILTGRKGRSSKPTTNKISRISERQPIKSKRLSERQPIEFLWIRDQSYFELTLLNFAIWCFKKLSICGCGAHRYEIFGTLSKRWHHICVPRHVVWKPWHKIYEICMYERCF